MRSLRTTLFALSAALLLAAPALAQPPRGGMQLAFPSPNDYYDEGAINILYNAFALYKKADLTSDLGAHFQKQLAAAQGTDRLFPVEERAFFYMPLMHSENVADQERCIALFREAEHAEGIEFAELHAEVIRRFGRFPHRNAVLGRASTEEERAFLEAGGGFG